MRRRDALFSGSFLGLCCGTEVRPKTAPQLASLNLLVQYVARLAHMYAGGSHDLAPERPPDGSCELDAIGVMRSHPSRGQLVAKCLDWYRRCVDGPGRRDITAGDPIHAGPT